MSAAIPRLALLAGAAVLALPQPVRAQRLERPDALRLSAAQAGRMRRLRGRSPEEFYPAQAREQRLDGYVRVDLLLNEVGLVVEASVVQEDPPGQGFGLAALDVTKTWEYLNELRRLVLMEVGVEFLP